MVKPGNTCFRMVLQYHLLEALRLNHMSSVSGEVKLMKLDVDGTGGQGMLRVYVNALNDIFRKRAKSMP